MNLPCRRCGEGLVDLSPVGEPGRVLVLLATIPTRRASAERLLAQLPAQRRVPDAVVLCLDGYGEDLPAPVCPLPVLAVYRTAALSGPGARWRVARDLRPQDLLVTLDDDADLSEAPEFLEALVRAAGESGAAAAMGYTPSGHRLGTSRFAANGRAERAIELLSWRRLLLGCGCGLTVRARHLCGLQDLAAEVEAAGGPAALGPLGDDQALVSAHLWRQGVPLLHAPAGRLRFAEGTQEASETRGRQARGEATLFEQAAQIAHVTGWPLAEPVIEVQTVQAEGWDAEVTALPPGAVRAEGPRRPGLARVCLMGPDPAQNGLYDVPEIELLPPRERERARRSLARLEAQRAAGRSAPPALPRAVRRAGLLRLGRAPRPPEATSMGPTKAQPRRSDKAAGAGIPAS